MQERPFVSYPSRFRLAPRPRRSFRAHASFLDIFVSTLHVRPSLPPWSFGARCAPSRPRCCTWRLPRRSTPSPSPRERRRGASCRARSDLVCSSTTNSTHSSTRIPNLGSLRPLPVEEWTAIDGGSSADVAPFRLRNGSRGNERETR